MKTLKFIKTQKKIYENLMEFINKKTIKISTKNFNN